MLCHPDIKMIELAGDTLRASFPEVHPDAVCEITFQRTLRIPDDGRAYPLPAGLGSFPVFDVADYPVPEDWKRHGGVFLPLHQSEAMWLRFRAPAGYPFAVKVAAGKVNAVTGGAWSEDIPAAPQDYVVIPEQPWLDGFCVEQGVVRQFVAAPLGAGETVEEQLTGQAEWGGLQFLFRPMKAEEYRIRFELPRQASAEIDSMLVQLDAAIQRLDAPFLGIDSLLQSHERRMAEIGHMASKHMGGGAWGAVEYQVKRYTRARRQIEAVRDSWQRRFRPYRKLDDSDMDYACPPRRAADQAGDPGMGLAAGGMIKQEIAQDPYGIGVWDTQHVAPCYVHLVNSERFTAITGKQPPMAPITARDYAAAGIPWFDYYLDGPALSGSSLLAGVQPLSASMQAKGQELSGNEPTTVAWTTHLSPKKPKPVSEGVF